MTPLASSYLKGLAQGRKINSASRTNMRGMLWDLRLGSDSLAAEGADSLTFDLNPGEPQMLVLVYPTDEVSANRLLYEMARHNFASFLVRDFELEPMNFGRLGLLLVKGFANFDELVHYRDVLASSQHIALPPQVRPVMISAKNFDTLLRGGLSFDDYFRYVEAEAADAPLLIGPAPDTSPEQPEAPESVDADPAVPEEAPQSPEAAPQSPEVPATEQPARGAPGLSKLPLPEYPAGSEGDDPYID